MSFFSPDGLDLEQLPLEYFDGFTSLEIVVLEDIASAYSFPVAYTGRTEIAVVCILSDVRRIYFSKRMMWGMTVSWRFLSSQTAMGIEMRFPL